jgi:hypothetical protein
MASAAPLGAFFAGVRIQNRRVDNTIALERRRSETVWELRMGGGAVVCSLIIGSDATLRFRPVTLRKVAQRDLVT